MTLPLLATVAALAVFLVGLSSWQKGTAEQETLKRRSALDQAEARAGRLSSRLDVRLRRTRPGRRLRLRMDRAGVAHRVVDVAAVLAALFALTFLLSVRIISWWVALVVAVLVVRLALTWFDRLERQRREAFIGQLPEVARVLSNATAAGRALRSAIAKTADDVGAPASEELQWLSGRLALGVALEDALTELEERLPSRELSLLTRTLVIQARAGGAVVTALQAMSQTLDARKDLRREIHTMLSGAVFTSYVVLLIGAGALVMLNVIIPGTLHRMTTSLVGQATLLVAGLLYTGGFLLIRRATRVDV